MLSTSSAALLALGSAIVLVVPGPTNTLLATAGLRRGMRRSAHLTGGEFAGYLVSISAWGLFLSHAATSLTWLPTLLRLASSLYLAYLSVRMWQTANSFSSSAHATIGLRTLFVATLLNPKAILFAGTIFPAAVFQRTVGPSRSLGWSACCESQDPNCNAADDGKAPHSTASREKAAIPRLTA